MREIKFRAWDEGNKKMWNNVNFLKSGDDGDDWIVPIIVEEGWGEDLDPYFRQQFKLMQYTGLKDKNDQEIYEGDILTIDGNPKENGCCYVYYSEDEMSYYLKDDLYDISMAEIREHNGFDKLEVVGNIHENHELLEVNKK